VFIAGSGCGGKQRPNDLPTLYPCEITVIQDGKPLSEATVLFYPLNGNLRFAIGGKTNQNGILVPKTDGEWDGIPQGEYRISISKQIAPTDIPLPGPQTPLEERRKMLENQMKLTKETVDPKFSDRTKSELRLKVEGKAVKESFDVGQAVDISLRELNPKVKPYNIRNRIILIPIILNPLIFVIFQWNFQNRIVFVSTNLIFNLIFQQKQP
jgi:hypothetical protein